MSMIPGLNIYILPQRIIILFPQSAAVFAAGSSFPSDSQKRSPNRRGSAYEIIKMGPEGPGVKGGGPGVLGDGRQIHFFVAYSAVVIITRSLAAQRDQYVCSFCCQILAGKKEAEWRKAPFDLWFRPETGLVLLFLLWKQVRKGQERTS